MLGTIGRGQTRLADAAYDSDALRRTLADRDTIATIKPLGRRTTAPGFDRTTYRKRNRIERLFNKLKHFSAIATRYEKHDASYIALVKLAAIRIWLRNHESVA